MPLSDLLLRKAQPGDRSYKIADGKGLYALVHPRGSIYWRYDYRLNGKRCTLALGVYPEVRLAEARILHQEAQGKVARGEDPALERKREKWKAEAETSATFGKLADEYLERLERQKRSPATLKKNRWYLKVLAADLSAMQMTEVKAADVLRVLKKIEASGRVETAHRVRAGIGSVFRLAISTLRAEHDPTAALRGALMPPVVTPQPAIVDEDGFGGLLTSIDEYDGWPTIRAALQLMALCYPRPIELRKAEWSHIDLKERVWSIPAHLSKMRRPHDIPLSHQAVRILESMHRFSGDCRLVLPSIRSKERPLSENAMNSALRRMGYEKHEHTSHGFRSSASTILNKHRYPIDVIEASLAHLDPNEVRRTYNRYQYWEERVQLAQDWADICDKLKRKKRDHSWLI